MLPTSAVKAALSTAAGSHSSCALSYVDVAVQGLDSNIALGARGDDFAHMELAGSLFDPDVIDRIDLHVVSQGGAGIEVDRQTADGIGRGAGAQALAEQMERGIPARTAMLNVIKDPKFGEWIAADPGLWGHLREQAEAYVASLDMRPTIKAKNVIRETAEIPIVREIKRKYCIVYA